MADHFAMLGLPRAPWLDPAIVKEQFARLSLDAHPDKFKNAPAEVQVEKGQWFAALNTAQGCLKDTKRRLHHLLELEKGQAPASLMPMPDAMTSMFMEVGAWCRDVDRFLADSANGESPLAKLAHMRESLTLTERMEPLRARITDRQSELRLLLERLNPAWLAASSTPSGTERSAALPLQEVEAILNEWSFLARWQEQLQERSFKLMV